MMNNLRRVTASFVMVLLGMALWSSAGRSQDGSSRTSAIAGTSASADASQGRPAGRDPMGADEKLVRDVYARLMRYQSAAIDEQSVRTNQPGQPNDYLTFALRNIYSGAVADIYDRPLADLVTPPGDVALSLKPVYLGEKNQQVHAYYEAQWNLKSAPRGQPELVSDVAGVKDYERFISYEVTLHFQGRDTTYRAMVLYQPGQTSARPSSADILDNVTGNMNTVYKDESPRVRSPWNKYVKTSLYQAVARTIKETRDSGRPLIPDDAPIGYLPGDDVSPNDQDARTMATNAVCPDLIILRDGNPITGTTQSAVVGERINLSVETGSGDPPSNIQWSIGGNKVANYVANGSTGAVTALTNLTNDTLNYYWFVSGQGIEISVTATAFETEVTKYAWFNVAGPSDTEPAVTLPTNGQINVRNLGPCSGGPPGPAMVFGSISGPNAGCTYSGLAGIDFTPPGATGPAGTFFFVQLVTADTVIYSRTNATSTCTGTNMPGLDADYPYQGKYGQLVNDAPFSFLPGTYTNSSRDFAATMYLMWQSNNSGSIPVPMGSVNWGFSGATSQPQANSGNWSAPSGSGAAQPFASASGLSSFPQWTGVVGNPSNNCH